MRGLDARWREKGRPGLTDLSSGFATAEYDEARKLAVAAWGRGRVEHDGVDWRRPRILALIKLTGALKLLARGPLPTWLIAEPGTREVMASPNLSYSQLEALWLNVLRTATRKDVPAGKLWCPRADPDRAALKAWAPIMLELEARSTAILLLEARREAPLMSLLAPTAIPGQGAARTKQTARAADTPERQAERLAKRKREEDAAAADPYPPWREVTPLLNPGGHGEAPNYVCQCTDDITCKGCRTWRLQELQSDWISGCRCDDAWLVESRCKNIPPTCDTWECTGCGTHLINRQPQGLGGCKPATVEAVLDGDETCVCDEVEWTTPNGIVWYRAEDLARCDLNSAGSGLGGPSHQHGAAASYPT